MITATIIIFCLLLFMVVFRKRVMSLVGFTLLRTKDYNTMSASASQYQEEAEKAKSSNLTWIIITVGLLIVVIFFVIATVKNWFKK